MASLIITVGLPASGKSTYCNELEKQGTCVISSDALREELLGDVGNQEANDDVFKEMYRRAEVALRKGMNVVLDSTNVSSKRRKQLIERFKKQADQIVATYFDTPYVECLSRNKERDRVVPNYVIKRMYKTLEIPLHEEGFDEINIISRSETMFDIYFNPKEYLEHIISKENPYDEFFVALTAEDAFRNIYELAHDSTYHNLSVSRHTYHVWEYILENYNGTDKLAMLWASLFHDTGKAFCKSFEKRDRSISRFANFIGHEFVSGQLACNFLIRLGYDKNFVLNVVQIVQNHMKILNTNGSEKGLRKLQKFVGEDVYEKLQFFREADAQAH